jgi:hypothetical protein
MFTIKKHSTNETIQVSKEFINYSNLYINMLEDLGNTEGNILPYPETWEFKFIIELYDLYEKMQALTIKEMPYIDYFSRNYELFMNNYPRINKPVPLSNDIILIFSNYSIKILTTLMKLCDFFDMPMLSKIIGMGIATFINNKTDPDEIKSIYHQIKEHMNN